MQCPWRKTTGVGTVRHSQVHSIADSRIGRGLGLVDDKCFVADKLASSEENNRVLRSQLDQFIQGPRQPAVLNSRLWPLMVLVCRGPAANFDADTLSLPSRDHLPLGTVGPRHTSHCTLRPQ